MKEELLKEGMQKLMDWFTAAVREARELDPEDDFEEAWLSVEVQEGYVEATTMHMDNYKGDGTYRLYEDGTFE